MAVEQEGEILNEGDIFMAWERLRQLIEEGEPLPDWAARYFLKVAAAMDGFDPFEDDATDLLTKLGIKYSPMSAPRRRKAKLDYDHIYRCFSQWLMAGEQESIAECINQYVSKFSDDNADEPLDSDSVKSAYYSVRRERLLAMDQDRPNMTKTEWQRYFGGDG